MVVNFTSKWDSIDYHSRHKNICQKIQPAHSMITKRDCISRGSCFCEKYIIVTNEVCHMRASREKTLLK